MGQELLLTSARVLPAKLNAAGYRFRYTQLPDALRAALG
jgi:NAD dependent epimerase/dehydratase family enzyme